MRWRKTGAFLKAHVGHVGDDCLVWPYGRDGQGYARACVVGHSSRLAHRIMCEMAHGSSPSPGAVARHTCGRGHEGCVNPRHLVWGTQKENISDMEAHGTKAVGQRIARSVLDPEKVRRIRHKHASGEPQRSIAAGLGIHHTTVQAVIERRTWGHIE